MNIKKYVTLLSILSAMNAHADKIDHASARKIAAKILGTDNITLLSPSSHRSKASTTSAPAYYIFSTPSHGFVILSGDDCMPTVIGYSHSETLDIANMPAPLMSYLDSYTDHIGTLRATGQNAKRNHAAQEPGDIIVEPIIKSKWGQGTPFNDMSPIYDGTHAPTGCAATAVSMIMRHWQWPDTGVGTITYSYQNSFGYQSISRDFYNSTYDWASMKDTGLANAKKQESRDAVALLNYDCGTAIQMQYDVDGSGAQPTQMRTALPKFFKYKGSTIELVYRECLDDDSEWFKIIKNELDCGRPILYGAYDDNGKGGHAFILDGYDSNGYGHINWGWDGSANGYFNLDDLSPTNYDFNQSPQIIIGIEPDHTGKDNKIKQYRMYMKESPAIVEKEVSLGEQFTFQFKTLANLTYMRKTWAKGVALYNKTGELVQQLDIETDEPDITIDYLYNIACPDVKVRLPKVIADGDYTVRAIFRENGYDDFILPEVFGGSKLNAIPVYIHGGKAHFNEVSTSVELFATSPNAASFDLLNLSGQRVTSSYRGIVIKSGKKYVR